MSAVIDRAPITSGLKAMLLAALSGAATDGRNLYVEVGSAPAESLLFKDAQGKLIDPYGIVYPITGVEFHGSLGQPDRAGALPYQLTWVGRTYQSAQVIADLGRHAVLDRTANGSFLHPLTAGASMVISDRRQSEIGTAEPSEGLWQVVDTYALQVESQE